MANASARSFSLEIEENEYEAFELRSDCVKDGAKAVANLTVDFAAMSLGVALKNALLPAVMAPIQTVRPLAAMCGASASLNSCQAAVTETVTGGIDSALESTANVAKAAIGVAVDTTVDTCVQVKDSCVSNVGSLC